MRIRIFAFFLIFCSLAVNICFCENKIELNLIDKKIKLLDFSLGSYKVDGSFSFELKEDKSSLIFNLKGDDILLTIPNQGKENVKRIEWIRLQLVKVGNLIFIKELSLPEFEARGNVNLEKDEFALGIDAGWQHNSKNLKGLVKVKAKLWGSLDNFLTSGHLIITNGSYKNSEFSQFRIDFLGKPPVLNITESRAVLTDGTVLSVKGELNLRDFAAPLAGAEFTPQKIFVGDWQLFSQADKDIGLKKDI